MHLAELHELAQVAAAAPQAEAVKAAEPDMDTAVFVHGDGVMQRVLAEREHR